MFALIFLEINFENCLIKIAGARKLIFKCLSHTLIEKFLMLSLSNKEALLIKQLKNWMPLKELSRLELK